MYAFMMRPDTLPPSYNAWIGQAAKIPVALVDMNRGLIREGKFDISSIDAIFSKAPVITPFQNAELVTRRAMASLPVPDYGLPFGPCAGVHPHLDSCLVAVPDTFWQVFKWMVPVYGALHFIPMLLFKRHTFIKTPIKMLLKAALGTTRSSTFLGVFVIMYKCALVSSGSIWSCGYLEFDSDVLRETQSVQVPPR